MVRDGYGNSERWQYTGQKMAVQTTGWFKRVKVGYCRNLKEVIKKLKEHGKPGHGQFRNVFKRTFEPDGTLTGFADPSWEDPKGDVVFPCVDFGGNSGFDWAGFILREDWFWVVEVSK